MAPFARNYPTPVTILAGFLGSGKTTLLNWLLRAPHGHRVAVIVNEFGQVGVDGALVQGGEQFVELDNGCLCCALNADLDRTVRMLVERGGFDRIVVETTGLADPLPVAWSFMRPGLSEALRVDAIVVVVDAGSLERALTESSEARVQLQRADLVVLNKLDLVDDDGAQARARIRSINAQVPVLPAMRAEAPYALLFDVEWAGLNAARYAEAPPQPAAAATPASAASAASSVDAGSAARHALPHAKTLPHHTAFQTYTWQAPEGAVLDERRLEDFVYEVPTSIYRFKGLVRTNSDWGPWSLINAVAGRIDLRPYTPQHVPARSSIVFIGLQCDKVALAALCQPLLLDEKG